MTGVTGGRPRIPYRYPPLTDEQRGQLFRAYRRITDRQVWPGTMANWLTAIPRGVRLDLAIEAMELLYMLRGTAKDLFILLSDIAVMEPAEQEGELQRLRARARMHASGGRANGA